MHIKTIAVKSGMLTSGVATGDFTINWQTVSTPQFSPVAGPYYSDQAVTISCTTPDVTIYYTIDGTDPSTASQVFNPASPIAVVGNQNYSTNTTIKALGVKTGMTNSTIASAAYTISYPPVSPPQFSPAGGVYQTPQSVTITDATNGATIYYTTDGSTPTTSSPVYNNVPIGVSNIGSTTTINAIAAKAGMTTSTVTSGSFSVYQFAKWAVTTVSTPTSNCYSSFNGAVADSTGNIYVAGSLNFETTGTFSFGNGVTVSRSTTGNQPSAVLLKYNSAGVAQWVQSVNDDLADYNSVAIDSSGNLYAAGDINGTTSYSFGNGITAQGTSASFNIALVKYDSSGLAQWARTFTSGSVSFGGCYYRSVAVSSAGDILAAGDIGSSGTLGFGNGVSVTADSTYKRPIVVKYDALGVPRWARTVSSSTASDGRFFAVAAESSGNVFAAGYLSGAGTYDFGDGVTAVGTAPGNNALLVKYNSAGSALWARVVGASFRAVSVDSLGNVYVAGAGDVTLAKYDTGGGLLWSGNGGSYFGAIASDSLGNVYAAGNINVGTSTITFGNGVFVTGSYPGANAVLVKYNSAGVAQWAQTTITAPNQSTYGSEAVDSSGNIYVVGYLFGGSTFDFGNSVNATGQSAMNPLLVKY
jgi:hypothetical protein